MYPTGVVGLAWEAWEAQRGVPRLAEVEEYRVAEAGEYRVKAWPGMGVVGDWSLWVNNRSRSERASRSSQEACAPQSDL